MSLPAGGPAASGDDAPTQWGATTAALVIGAIVVSILLGASSLGCITENKDHYAAICSASQLGNDAFALVLIGGPILIGVTGAITNARRNGVWLAAGCAVAATGYLAVLIFALG